MNSKASLLHICHPILINFLSLSPKKKEKLSEPSQKKRGAFQVNLAMSCMPTLFQPLALISQLNNNNYFP